MKIIIIYPYISDQRGHFDEYAIRFFTTLAQFNPGERYELAPIACNVPYRFINLGLDLPIIETKGTYLGGGFDIGLQIWAANTFDCDMMISCTSKVYFKREGWLTRLVEVRRKLGNGLYGPMASYENLPHIRAAFYGCDPAYIRNYPLAVRTKEESLSFESGEPNFTNLVEQWSGLSSKMVTWDGVYERAQWRTPPNIFRRGDQSNCMVYDRHTLIYELADAQEKLVLSKRADGIH